MGIRLYPISQEPSLIEKLADVPEGTTIKLNELEKKKKEISEYDYYNQIYDNEDFRKLNSFHLFGWGRVDWNKVKPECFGEAKGIQARELLEDTNCPSELIELVLVDGVMWS